MNSTTLPTRVEPSAAPVVLRKEGVFRLLRDGTSVQIRLLSSEDGEALRRFHTSLSPESTRMRYFTTKTTLSDKELAYLCDVDVVNRCALAVVEHGEIIAIGRWMRPVEGSSDAEVAFAVSDAEQGRGIGTTLLEMLIDLAPAYEISAFTASVLFENHKMSKVLRRCGYKISVEMDSGVREMVIDLTSRVE